MKLGFVNGRIFDGREFHSGHALLVERGLVKSLTRGQDLPGDARGIDLKGDILAPGFIDIQVNGGGGMLFNDHPGPKTIRRIIEAHAAFGTTGLLPTLTSGSWETMRTAAEAVQEAMRAGQPGLLGVHFEGPYLSKKRPGIHDPGFIRPPDEGALELFTRPDLGRVIVTLAPEKTGPQFIGSLKKAGVLVCAGHSAADYGQTVAALKAGVRGFTHLFNAMTPFGSREPGMVGAALEDPGSWCGLINDHHHIHPASLRVAISAKPRGKMLLITDAMPPVGAGEAEFDLYGQRIRVEGGRCVSKDGVLAGSVLDMSAAVRNTVSLGLELGEALRMASAYPADFLGLNGSMGRIFPGARADLVRLDEGLRVRAAWIGGVLMESSLVLNRRITA